MTVARLELEVPDLDRARRLFVDLLGGTLAPSRDADAFAVDVHGGAQLGLRPGRGQRADLQTLVLTTDAGRAPDTRALLGTRVAVVPLGASPVDDHIPRGSAGALHLDHVCFAVRSLRDAVGLLRDELGGHVVFGGHERTNGTLSSQVDLGGGTRVELLEPTRPDAAVAGYLERFGPGMHHLTWKVADVPAAIAAAEDVGFPTTGTDLDRRPHWRETYLRPGTALGVLVQLAWTDRSHTTPLDDATVERILSGRVDSHDYEMRLG